MEECSKKSLGFYLGYINREAHKYFTKEFNAINLNRGNVYILKQLYRQDGLAQNQISSNLHLDKAGIARNINKLIDAGIIEKIIDKKDKRVNRIFLTQKGKNLEKQFHNIFRSWEEKITAGFTSEELQIISQFIQRMTSNIEENI